VNYHGFCAIDVSSRIIEAGFMFSAALRLPWQHQAGGEHQILR
jgi:hypothetical protein